MGIKQYNKDFRLPRKDIVVLLQIPRTLDLPKDTSKQRLATTDRKVQAAIGKLGKTIVEYCKQVSSNQICFI